MTWLGPRKRGGNKMGRQRSDVLTNPRWRGQPAVAGNNYMNARWWETLLAFAVAGNTACIRGCGKYCLHPRWRRSVSDSSVTPRWRRCAGAKLRNEVDARVTGTKNNVNHDQAPPSGGAFQTPPLPPSLRQGVFYIRAAGGGIRRTPPPSPLMRA